MSSIAADLMALCPFALLTVGWVRWFRGSGVPNRWRQKAVAIGLSFASASCVCLCGVILYLQKAHLGYWNEYSVGAKWGIIAWPMSGVALILGVVGQGASRGFLILAGLGLIVEWTMAFVH